MIRRIIFFLGILLLAFFAYRWYDKTSADTFLYKVKNFSFNNNSYTTTIDGKKTNSEEKNVTNNITTWEVTSWKVTNWKTIKINSWEEKTKEDNSLSMTQQIVTLRFQNNKEKSQQIWSIEIETGRNNKEIPSQINDGIMDQIIAQAKSEIEKSPTDQTVIWSGSLITTVENNTNKEKQYTDKYSWSTTIQEPSKIEVKRVVERTQQVKRTKEIKKREIKKTQDKEKGSLSTQDRKEAEEFSELFSQ